MFRESAVSSTVDTVAVTSPSAIRVNYGVPDSPGRWRPRVSAESVDRRPAKRPGPVVVDDGRDGARLLHAAHLGLEGQRAPPDQRDLAPHLLGVDVFGEGRARRRPPHAVARPSAESRSGIPPKSG